MWGLSRCTSLMQLVHQPCETCITCETCVHVQVVHHRLHWAGSRPVSHRQAQTNRSLTHRLHQAGVMHDADAWDLEMELLCLPASGSSVAQLQRLASKIANCCKDAVPDHVRELASLSGGSNLERDLHRWVSRQRWRELLPDPYFSICLTLRTA